MSAQEAPFEEIVESKYRETWLAERRKGIGSSDAPAILGLSPYASALTVYTRKLGLQEEQPETEAMKWGTRLEPLVREAFQEETKRHVFPWGYLCRSKAYPWALATPDGYQAKEELGRTGLLEIKTSGYSRDEWDEGVPAHVNAQVQHQLMVTGLGWASVAVLIGGQKLLWADVERDSRFIDEVLLPAEEEFWNERVLKQMPPPPDGTDSSGLALKLLYPQATGGVITLPGSFIDLDAERAQLKAQEKEISEQLAAIDQQIKAALGEHEAGVLPNGVTYTYRNQHRDEHLVPAVDFRVLRRSAKKGA